MKIQIVIIHGGEAFKNYRNFISYLKKCSINFDRIKHPRSDWKKTLAEKLGKKFEVISPVMPNKFNSKYSEWKIWFERLIPYFEKEVILIGHSLGGLFLVKYLSENNFPKKVLATFIVAAPYGYVSFTKPKTFKKLEKQGGKIFLFHSKNDKVVPFSDFKQYAKNLKTATPRIFKNKGHFNQERFPELIKDIKKLF